MPCLHCVNSTYTWTASGSPYPPDGTAFLTFLYGLNGGVQSPQGYYTCFAGHCDWRLPIIEELEAWTRALVQYVVHGDDERQSM